MGEATMISTPIPHLVTHSHGLDSSLLRQALHEWPAADWPGWYQMRSWKEDKWASRTGAVFPGSIRVLLDYLNGGEFVRRLEAWTGINGLIPDPHFHGGGLHEIRPGGFLKLHRDFNWHPDLKLVRRVNVLLYLNPDWDEDWGGHLELRYLSKGLKTIAPVMGRMVILDTQAPGVHGHPDPLACPEGVARRSLAAYYYTAGKVEREMGTQYAERFAGEFRRTARDRIEALAKDWIPPALLRIKRSLTKGTQ